MCSFSAFCSSSAHTTGLEPPGPSRYWNGEGVVSVTGISCASQPSLTLSPDPAPPLQLSHKPHPKWNTDMVFKTIKKTILWIHGLHKCKKHNKNIVSGAITWFWLSQWYSITLCSCYNAGTWPPSSFCWGERMVVNEMCGLGSSALLLPMAGVSWVFCACNTQQNYVFICVPPFVSFRCCMFVGVGDPACLLASRMDSGVLCRQFI